MLSSDYALIQGSCTKLMFRSGTSNDCVRRLENASNSFVHKQLTRASHHSKELAAQLLCWLT